MTPGSMDEKELALKYSPLLFLDDREPFLPYKVGYTVFGKDARSYSFKRMISLGKDEICIEYAIFWDFDIEHMYDLEHLWVYVKDNKVIKFEGSWHGRYLVFKEFQLIDSHPVAYAQPGKHAFSSVKDCFNSNLVTYLMTIIPCRFLAGRGGVLRKEFEKSLKEEDKILVKNYLKKFSFWPSFSFNKRFEINESNLIPWKELNIEISKRIEYLLLKIKEGF